MPPCLHGARCADQGRCLARPPPSAIGRLKDDRSCMTHSPNHDRRKVGDQMRRSRGVGSRGLWGNKPAVVNGEPLSLTTKGDVGLSRCSRRSARSSTPWIGWVLGVPFFTRRTCSTAPLKSTWSQRRRAGRGHGLEGSWSRHDGRDGCPGPPRSESSSVQGFRSRLRPPAPRARRKSAPPARPMSFQKPMNWAQRALASPLIDQ
jgi:hypothetical protein